MDVEFDRAKDAANIAKHGVSLADAAKLDLLTAAVIVDDRRDYGERATALSAGSTGSAIISLSRCAAPRCARSASAGPMRRKCAAMANDDDTPEWTDAEIAAARPGAEVLPEAFVAALKRKRGRPVGSTTSAKTRVTLRLDRDAVERLKATGPGWQSRINEAVRKVAGL